MQSVADSDLDVVAKFDSYFTEKYQIHGINIEQNSDNFIRCDRGGPGKHTTGKLPG